MLNFSKTKIFLIIVVCLSFLFYSIPSFLASDSKIARFFPSSKINLGLDLKGGSQLMLEVNSDYYIKEQLNNLRNEIKSSFRDESIRTIPEIQGSKITFSLTDEEQQKKAKKIIKKLSKNIDIDESNGSFVVYFSDQELELMKNNLIKQSIEIVRRRIDETGTKEPTIQAQGKDRILLQVPGVENSEEIKSVLGKTAKMTFHFVSEISNQDGIDPEADRLYDASGNSYLIKREVVLSGDLLTDASPTYYEGGPAVAFRFNDVGTRKFAEITRNNVGKFFAIVLDGKVITAPRINTVIDQGSGVISGNFTTKEASEVALLLRAGSSSSTT